MTGSPDHSGEPVIEVLSRREVKIEPRRVLEEQTSFHAIGSTPYYNQRCRETNRLKALLHFDGVPDLAVLCFQVFTTAGLSVDFGNKLAANGFGRIGHGYLQERLLIGTKIEPVSFQIMSAVRMTA